MKAAAHTSVGERGDAARGRHRRDFATLAALLAARDFREADLSPKDRKRLRDMVAAIRRDDAIMTGMDGAADALDRLERGARLAG